MYGPTKGQVITAAAIVGIIGWAVIEGVLFVLRHLTWGW